MTTTNVPEIIQKQVDLQYDLVNEIVLLDEDVTTISPELRQKITDLKTLSIAIQRAPEESLSIVLDDNQNNDFWGQIIAEMIKQSVEYALGWFAPGQRVSLYNNTDTAIFVRTYDQRDNLHWIAYGSWTINPRSYSVIAARGSDNIQVDIGGRIFRCPIGIPQAYDGNTILQYRPS